MSRQDRRARAAAGQLSWWEKIMFSFMGPPQLGDINAPTTYQGDPRADLCGRCGQPWAAHERVRASTTSLKCPTPQG